MTETTWFYLNLYFLISKRDPNFGIYPCVHTMFTGCVIHSSFGAKDGQPTPRRWTQRGLLVFVYKACRSWQGTWVPRMLPTRVRRGDSSLTHSPWAQPLHSRLFCQQESWLTTACTSRFTPPGSNRRKDYSKRWENWSGEPFPSTREGLFPEDPKGWAAMMKVLSGKMFSAEANLCSARISGEHWGGIKTPSEAIRETRQMEWDCGPLEKAESRWENGRKPVPAGLWSLLSPDSPLSPRTLREQNGRDRAGGMQWFWQVQLLPQYRGHTQWSIWLGTAVGKKL